MSRAFVKEIENDTTGLPDRPIELCGKLGDGVRRAA
jgi:hypothetical protein